MEETIKYNVLREITDWNMPSHTYVTIRRNQRVIGYYKNNADPYLPLVKPTRFETARRKFESDRVREKEWNANSE